jgi:hypothetical protein
MLKQRNLFKQLIKPPHSSWTIELKITSAESRGYIYNMKSTRKQWHFDFIFTLEGEAIPYKEEIAALRSQRRIAASLRSSQ